MTTSAASKPYSVKLTTALGVPVFGIGIIGQNVLHLNPSVIISEAVLSFLSFIFYWWLKHQRDMHAQECHHKEEMVRLANSAEQENGRKEIAEKAVLRGVSFGYSDRAFHADRSLNDSIDNRQMALWDGAYSISNERAAN